MSTAVLPAGKRKQFSDLPLSSALLKVLDRVGYRHPTPIQAVLIPYALKNRDVIGQAQTGTGKTASFLVPFFQSWTPAEGHEPVGLVLTPTRELTVQVCEEAQRLSPSKLCRPVAIYGGQRIGEQFRELRQGASLVVGTPGRILDHLARGTLSLERIRYVVLDEADRMLDIGFRPDIERILKRCPEERQTLLLSATLPDPVLRLAKRYMHKPVRINLSPAKITVDNIRQTYFTVSKEHKFELLLRVLEREKPKQCIIFSARKRWADDVYRKLREVHRGTAAMHGDLAQAVRTRIMERFRNGSIVYLVATDVVGRGIDVTGISHIINYDLPEDPENYVHRIGRTGRMGKNGVAIAFVTPDQGEELTRIESYINKLLEEERFDDFQAVPPRPAVVEEALPPEEKNSGPVFGRRVRRYSRRL